MRELDDRITEIKELQVTLQRIEVVATRINAMTPGQPWTAASWNEAKAIGQELQDISKALGKNFPPDLQRMLDMLMAMPTPNSEWDEVRAGV